MHKHALTLVAFGSLWLGACVATVRPGPGPGLSPAQSVLRNPVSSEIPGFCGPVRALKAITDPAAETGF